MSVKKAGCETHQITTDSKTWSNLQKKLTQIINSPESTSRTPCPLCILSQLSKVENIIGQKAKNVITAYEALLKAEQEFAGALDNENVEVSTVGPIASLELDDDIDSVSHVTKKSKKKNRPKRYYGKFEDEEEEEDEEDVTEEVDEDDMPF